MYFYLKANTKYPHISHLYIIAKTTNSLRDAPSEARMVLLTLQGELDPLSRGWCSILSMG